MKHISHFVLPGAVYRPVEGSAKRDTGIRKS